MIEHFVQSASTYSADIDFVIELIFWIVGVWFVLTEGVFFWLLFRFRKTSDEQKAQYIQGTEPEFVRWVTWPHFLILVCDVFILVFAVKVWVNVKQELPEPDASVAIVSQQWAWSFVHEGPDGELGTVDDITMVDELHIEVDKTYHYILTSEDVVHSFSVPVFRLKQDAVPGREITGWFEATQTGEFGIQCAEMCGIGHGIMAARIFIETPEEHRAWVAAHSSVAELDTDDAPSRHSED